MLGLRPLATRALASMAAGNAYAYQAGAEIAFQQTADAVVNQAGAEIIFTHRSHAAVYQAGVEVLVIQPKPQAIGMIII